jgi:hypothetical protein
MTDLRDQFDSPWKDIQRSLFRGFRPVFLSTDSCRN